MQAKNKSASKDEQVVEYAMSAKEEFILLESEFEKLKEKSKIEIKVYDKLKVEFEKQWLDRRSGF